MSEAAIIPTYCEFERFFEDDVSRALQLPPEYVQVLFIKKAAPDAVLVQFRLFPFTNVTYDYANSNNSSLSYTNATNVSDSNTTNGTNSSSFALTLNTANITNITSEHIPIQYLMLRLVSLIADKSSSLYSGNVTIRTDSAWGLDGHYGSVRQSGPLFAYKHYDYNPIRLAAAAADPLRAAASQLTPYDRCKANRRCNWGITQFNHSSNEIQYYQRLYTTGGLFPVQLFLDFEQWRSGSQALSFDNTAASTATRPKIIPGAHFSPFLVTSIRNYTSSDSTSDNNNTITNSIGGSINSSMIDLSYTGIDLYYDTVSLHSVITALNARIVDLQERMAWLTLNREWYRMDGDRRSRRDVSLAAEVELKYFNNQLIELITQLSALNSTQCSNELDMSGCRLLFDTSTVTMTGLANVTGRLVTTAGGTEVAVFEFDSIFLGPEVQVTLVGQRALALISRSSAILNTSLVAAPGTLGGFQGGGNVGVRRRDLFNDVQESVYICDLTDSCSHYRTVADFSIANISSNNNYTNATSGNNDTIISANINGPGSSNVRIVSFVVSTSTKQVLEVQSITTRARTGQTLSGYFKLHYKTYSTQRISVSATASVVRKEIDDNLNRISPHSRSGFFVGLESDSLSSAEATIGVGAVWVTRSHSDDQGGYTWNVTFLSSVRPVEVITCTSYLTGIGAEITSSGLISANMLSGSFSLTFFPTTFNQTIVLAWNASATDFQQQLLTLSGVAAARVTRTNSAAVIDVDNCDEGLCSDGPTSGGGMTWTAYIAIYKNKIDVLKAYLYRSLPMAVDNIESSSVVYSDEADYLAVGHTIVFSIDSSALGGIDSAVTLSYGGLKSSDTLADRLLTNQTFHLAYGGAGASYGGRGGEGYAGIEPGSTYNEENMSDLVGGSGGAMRGVDVWELNAATTLGLSTGLGGAGGGAIELVAANDVTIGSLGVIDVSAADGQGSAKGGGGGGSGGGVLLAAGGSILHQGVIRATGGRGGYTGPRHMTLTGGGGSGGRVAMYGQSVTIIDKFTINTSSTSTSNNEEVSTEELATVDLSGGYCGGPIIVETMPALSLNLSISFTSPVVLRLMAVQRIAVYLVKRLLQPQYVEVLMYSNINNTYGADMNVDASTQLTYYNILLNITIGLSRFDNGSASSDIIALIAVDNITSMLESLTVNTSSTSIFLIAELSVIHTKVLSHVRTSFTKELHNHDCAPGKVGEKGSLYIQTIAPVGVLAHITRDGGSNGNSKDRDRRVEGVEGTNSAYYFSSRHPHISFATSGVKATVSLNSSNIVKTPINAEFAPSQPDRITFYLKLDDDDGSYLTSTYGVYIALQSTVADINGNSTNSSTFNSNSFNDPIAVSVGKIIKYGANVPRTVAGNNLLIPLTADSSGAVVAFNTWIKFDIRLNWRMMTFKLSVNDTEYVRGISFSSSYLNGLRFEASVAAVSFYIDEVYVGFDTTRDFSCPVNQYSGITTQSKQEDSGFGGQSQSQQNVSTNVDEASQQALLYKPMMRHYNHLSHIGSVAFDGQGEIRHRTERSAQQSSAEAPVELPKSVAASALLEDPKDRRIRYFYQYYAYSTITNTSRYVENKIDDKPYRYMGKGAIASCSTSNGQSWQFQGFVFQSINCTDTVFSRFVSSNNTISIANITTPSNFTSLITPSSSNITVAKTSASAVHIDKPAVIYNQQTKQYVMWLTLDDADHSLAMASVCSSPFADGPFLFLRSLYPDGNRTHDQVLSTSIATSDSSNYGVSNYGYESLDSNITTSSSLIRSYDYTLEYVKPLAVSQPVWESVKFDNGSVNFRLNYHRAYYAVGYDNYHDIYLQRWRLEDKEWSVSCIDKITGVERTTPPDCKDSEETKRVLGQGAPVVTTRFVSPGDNNNSWWMPSSVTGVQAQPWNINYRDGLCGIRQLNDGYDTGDPSLASFTPISRRDCSNIADNPPHVSAQDKLLGPKVVAFSRTARFVAISTLTMDSLDTSGVIDSVEGGIEGNLPLATLLDARQTFGISHPSSSSAYSLSTLSSSLDILSSGESAALLLSLSSSNSKSSSHLGSTYQPPLSLQTNAIGSSDDNPNSRNSNKDWSTQFKQYVYSPGDRSEYSLACVMDGTCSVNFRDQIITNY